MAPGNAMEAATRARAWLWFALVLLVSAYVQGGIDKAADFPSAVAEMRHVGLEPAVPIALATIALELGASAMILTGWMRWLGAALLAAFTLAATFMANRFWSAPPADRFMLENAFFEHLGLVGAFLLVAWIDWQRPGEREPIARF
jgi:uncharacterized membrane protein YphA (DoxX/SURF4 family)